MQKAYACSSYLCAWSPHSDYLRVFHLTLWTRHPGWHRTLPGPVQSHWGTICRDSSQRLCVSISHCRACATKVFCGLHFFIRNGVCADKTETNSYFRRTDLWVYLHIKVVKAKIDLLQFERAPSTSLRIVNHHIYLRGCLSPSFLLESTVSLGTLVALSSELLSGRPPKNTLALLFSLVYVVKRSSNSVSL